MKNFERWKAAYIAMDDRHRFESLEMAEGAAADNPRPKRLLLLVADNGDDQHLGDGLRGPHNSFTPVIIRSMGEGQ